MENPKKTYGKIEVTFNKFDHKHVEVIQLQGPDGSAFHIEKINDNHWSAVVHDGVREVHLRLTCSNEIKAELEVKLDAVEVLEHEISKLSPQEREKLDAYLRQNKLSKK
jgi:hypothetical protein